MKKSLHRRKITHGIWLSYQKKKRRLVELPKEKKAAQNKWIVQVTIKVDGSLDRFKTRLVA